MVELGYRALESRRINSLPSNDWRLFFPLKVQVFFQLGKYKEFKLIRCDRVQCKVVPQRHPHHFMTHDHWRPSCGSDRWGGVVTWVPRLRGDVNTLTCLALSKESIQQGSYLGSQSNWVNWRSIDSPLMLFYSKSLTMTHPDIRFDNPYAKSSSPCHGLFNAAIQRMYRPNIGLIKLISSFHLWNNLGSLMRRGNRIPWSFISPGL